ncbi:rhomboid family intramembrane serine protease [Congregibacter sp.]|uniref:rhomboid family intramembrane serine protease n=1 Tax=Congregibacter sp. TaxID=2744308 RepID=UPI00385F9126
MSVLLYRGSLTEDLRPLSALLWQQKIAHRIVEEDGVQVVLLAEGADKDRADDFLERWQSGELQVTLRPAPTVNRPKGNALPALVRSAPVTLALIAMSILGFLLVYLNAPVSWVAAFTYEPFTLQGGRPMFSEASGQIWRLVTPAFLHFGLMHIVFNSLWCWELGRRIESALGSFNLLGLFVATAALSNFAQHTVSGSVLFGGLSGVVYAFLGFSWVAGRINPRWQHLAPATPIMLFMVGWLVVCLLGLVDVLGFSVANAAHVGGLFSGSVIGVAFALLYRKQH